MKKLKYVLTRLQNQNFFLKTDIFNRFKLIFIWEYCFIRFIYLFYIKKKFSYYSNNKNIAGYEYSKKSFFDGKLPIYRPNDRVFYLYFNLISNPNIIKNNILILGPRYENEIYIAKSLGFKNIYALDIFSYSPNIEVGDIHDMKYKDNFFDCVVCGWTLSYSINPSKVINEIKRVLKKNGTVIFGVSKVRSEITKRESKEKILNILSDEDRIQSKEQFDKFFLGYKLTTIFEDKDTNLDSQMIIGYQKN